MLLPAGDYRRMAAAEAIAYYLPLSPIDVRVLRFFARADRDAADFGTVKIAGGQPAGPLRGSRAATIEEVFGAIPDLPEAAVRGSVERLLAGDYLALWLDPADIRFPMSRLARDTPAVHYFAITDRGRTIRSKWPPEIAAFRRWIAGCAAGIARQAWVRRRGVAVVIETAAGTVLAVIVLKSCGLPS